MKAEIKKEFQNNIIVIEHCLEQFKEELKRVDCIGEMRDTRKSRLNSLRKQIHTELLYIEQNYKGGRFDFERTEKNG